MAGEATIGALRVILGADTAKFEDNLKSAIGSLESFGKRIATIATGVGIERVFEKAFGAVVESITHAIDAADKLGKASQKFGIPVETLSALSNAAALSDVSVEQLGSSLSRLSKNMIAAEGPTSEQASAFAALGVHIKDSSGQLKNADQILLDVADSFSKFRDGTTKTALAIAIFGRAGADLIPFLDQSASGIKSLTDRMKDLGLVIDGQTAKAAEKFNDDLKTLGLAKDAIILKILGSSGMLDAMNKLTASMVEAAGESSKLAENLGAVLGPSITGVAKFLQELHDNIDGVVKAAKDLRDAWNLLANAQNAEGISKVGDALRDVGITTTEEAKSMAAAREQAKMFAVDFSDVNTALEAYIKAAGLAGAAPPFDPNATKNLENFRKHIEQISAAALDASGLFAGRLAPGFLQAAAGMEILKGQVKLTADGVADLGLKAEQLNQALLRLQGAKIIADNLPIWDQFNQKIAQTDAALRAAGATDEDFFRNHIRLAGDAAAATSGFFGFLESGFAAAASQNKQFAGIAKALAIVQATINTYEAATKAYVLFGGFPLGAAAAAATVAAGLGLVAKIQAQQFAKGGSFTVPGGSNSRDNVMVPLALSGGERVDVTPSSAVRDRGGRPREVVLSGLGPRDFFTGDMLRGLVDALNQGERDGYRLKFAER